jgi:hypothetical protein
VPACRRTWATCTPSPWLSPMSRLVDVGPVALNPAHCGRSLSECGPGNDLIMGDFGQQQGVGLATGAGGCRSWWQERVQPRMHSSMGLWETAGQRTRADFSETGTITGRNP